MLGVTRTTTVVAEHSLKRCDGDFSARARRLLRRSARLLSRDAERDEGRLRVKAREALEGHPVDEWKDRFADVIIKHSDEALAKPLFEGPVARGMRERSGEC